MRWKILRFFFYSPLFSKLHSGISDESGVPSSSTIVETLRRRVAARRPVLRVGHRERDAHYRISRGCGEKLGRSGEREDRQQTETCRRRNEQ